MADKSNTQKPAAPAENPDAAALAAENEELKKRLAKAEAKAAAGGDGALPEAYQQLYALKIKAGLEPAQALEVTRNQMKHDAKLAKA